MKINSITFENFRSYSKKTKVDFYDGMNLIFADNGSGKSTIIQGIRLMLFGYNQSKNLDSLVNWNSDEKTFYLEVDFDYEGANYVATWKYDKKGSPSSKRVIYKDGNQIIDGAEACKTYFAELFDTGLMDNALFARQNLNNIVEATDSERADVLKKIKDVDYTNRIRSVIDPEIESNTLEATDLSVDIRALEAKDYVFQEEYELPMDKKELENTEKELKLLEKELSLLEESNKKVDSLQEEVNQLVAKKTKLEDTETKKATTLEATEKKLTNEENKVIENKSDEIQEKIDAISPDSDLEESNKKYEAKIQEKTEKLNSVQKEIEGIKVERIASFDDSELDQIKEDLSKKKALLNVKKEKQALIEKGVCPTCNRPFDESHKDHQEESLSELEAEIQKLEDNKEKEIEKKKEKEKKIENNNLLKDKKAELRNSASLIESEIESLESEKKLKADSIKKESEQEKALLVQKLENEQERYNTAIETQKNNIDGFTETIESLKDELNDIKTDIASVESSINEKNKEIEEYEIKDTEELESNKIKLDQAIKNYYNTISKNEEIEKRNKELEEQRIIDNRQIKKLKKKKDKIDDRNLKLKEAKALLQKEIPSYIISQSIQEIQDGINTFVDNVYTRPLNIEFKLNKSSIAMNYGNKNKVPVKGGLSGAEQKMVQIGFIGKFNHDLGLSCIFLDEPDENISEKNSEKLYEILGELTSEFNQVFIITHQERMKEYLLNNYDSNVIRLTN